MARMERELWYVISGGYKLNVTITDLINTNQVSLIDVFQD